MSRFEELETRLERQEEDNFLLSRKLKSEQQKVLVFKNKEDPTAATVVSGDVDTQIAAIFPRSCQEIYDQNPTISTSTNGDQYIDPDGPGVGEPPIFVECADGIFTYHVLDTNIILENTKDLLLCMQVQQRLNPTALMTFL